MATPPVDLEHLRCYSLGDPALEAELFALFRNHVETWLARLDPAAADADWTAAAHTLKGSARGVGAFVMAEACAAAEALSGPAGDPGRRAEALSAVRGAAADALAFLDTLAA